MELEQLGERENGDPKPVSKQRDWGYSLGGRLQTGGANRLFFFYSPSTGRARGRRHQSLRCRPCSSGRGFSQTRDNNGALFNTIRITPRAAVHRADTRGCFQDGGVLGRIPQSRLYRPA